MGFRRQPEIGEGGRTWRQFTDRHSALIGAAGLPGWITERRDRWDDFLMHGHLDHHGDPSGFSVRSLTAAQFAALRALADRYFAETEANYTPMALLSRGPDGAS